MNQLYLITIKDHTFYCGAKNLSVIAEQYPNANKIEFVSEKVVFNSGDRYDLLKEAYNFISSGANTFSNEQRFELKDKIKLHLK